MDADGDVPVGPASGGGLRIVQPERGYRFSVDSLALAHFVGRLTSETVLDLGAGCGIISLMLAARHGEVMVHGVELQRSLVRLAEQNALDNGLGGRVRFHCLDMRRILLGNPVGPVDLVVCNPPFYPADSGRIPPDRGRALARHELEVSLPEVVEAASRMLRDGGRFVTIYPVSRMHALIAAMRQHALGPRILRMVHPKEKGPAKLILVEGVKGMGGPGETLPPLILQRASGEYTPEAAAMFLPLPLSDDSG